MELRLLRADEIDVRIGRMSKDKTGAFVLLYKDARCDMAILDEAVGAKNWKREHVNHNANCIVSIWNEEINQWVSKEDTGTESNTEQEKGLASDSFKRACVNWGIGRELYTAPDMYVKFEAGENPQYVKFYVSEINYDEHRRIEDVVIVDDKGNIRYDSKKWKKKKPATKKSTAKKTTNAKSKTAEKPVEDKKVVEMVKASDKQVEMIKELYSEADITKMIEGINKKEGTNFKTVEDITLKHASTMIEYKRNVK